MCERYEPDLPCHDATCATCQADPALTAVCECGDWQSDHPDGTEPCRLCRNSRVAWDHCDGFLFSHWSVRGLPPRVAS